MLEQGGFGEREFFGEGVGRTKWLMVHAPWFGNSAYQARLRLRKGIWSDIIAVLHDKESNCKHLNSHGLHICVRQVRDILPMERDALMQRSYFHDGNTLLNVYIERILDEGCTATGYRFRGMRRVFQQC